MGKLFSSTAVKIFCIAVALVYFSDTFANIYHFLYTVLEAIIIIPILLIAIIYFVESWKVKRKNKKAKK